MNFPFMISLGFIKIHPHLLFETLSYFIGFRLYLKLRRKERIPIEKSMWVIAGAILGAASGSKILAWMGNLPTLMENGFTLTYLLGGKTIVGGLLGGLIGVELTKKIINHRRSTGDDFVFPLMIGMMVGRIGCFLTGLEDNTFGTATSLPWGIDFGDGIPRHPTQLYEILFLSILGIAIYYRKKFAHKEGDLFKFFMAGYLTFRLTIDFIKPYPDLMFGLNHIQIACLLGIAYYLPSLPRLLKFRSGRNVNA